jgi:hypothetical protein
LILPSTDGVEEWRTKNISSSSDSTSITDGKIDSITADATPILSYQAKDMYDPEIHLPSAPIDWTGYEPSTPITEEITALVGVSGRYVREHREGKNETHTQQGGPFSLYFNFPMSDNYTTDRFLLLILCAWH